MPLMGCSETAGGGGSGGIDSSVNPSTGCDSGSLDSSATFVDISFDGMPRSYLLHVPASYDGSTPTPLVLNFHALTSTAPEQQFISDMDRVADAHRFVVAYPNGIEDSWNAGLCSYPAGSLGIDDVGFARAVIDDLGQKGCIDLNRVYATGWSNGAALSYRLACEATDVIAAIAPVANVTLVSDCNPSQPIPMMHFHGTDDLVVPYDGSRPGYPSVPDTHDAWAARNGCTDEPSVTFENNTVTCETYDECDGGVEVTLCTAEGMGHCWPGQSICPGGASTLDISASEAMADFFANFSLSETSGDGGTDGSGSTCEPGPEGSSYHVMQFTELKPDGSTPFLEGVKVCVADTENCGTSNESGGVALVIPADQEVTVTIEKEGYGRLVTGGVSDAPYVLGTARRMYTDAQLAAIAADLQTTYPWQGGVVGLVRYPVRAGATFTPVGSTVDAVGDSFYYDSATKKYSLDLEATTAVGESWLLPLGEGGFTEVTPGVQQFELGGTAGDCGVSWAWPGDTPNTIRVPVREGYRTYASMVCD